MGQLPKILIFTPIYDAKDYCLNKFLGCVNKLDYPKDRIKHLFIDNTVGLDYTRKLKRMGLNVIHIERGNNSREAITRSQALARIKFLKGDYDYLFSLESDIMIPKDGLTRLLKHAKEVVTGLYLIGNDKIKIPCITLPEWQENLKAFGTRLLMKEEVEQYVGHGLKRVQAGGFGCCLMSRAVVEKQGFYYDPRFQGHSDIYFFNDIFMKKIPVFVDTDLICDHDNSDWSKVEDR